LLMGEYLGGRFGGLDSPPAKGVENRADRG
jgi:hypothetical protein